MAGIEAALAGIALALAGLAFETVLLTRTRRSRERAPLEHRSAAGAAQSALSAFDTGGISLLSDDAPGVCRESLGFAQGESQRTAVQLVLAAFATGGISLLSDRPQAAEVSQSAGGPAAGAGS